MGPLPGHHLLAATFAVKVGGAGRLIPLVEGVHPGLPAIAQRQDNRVRRFRSRFLMPRPGAIPYLRFVVNRFEAGNCKEGDGRRSLSVPGCVANPKVPAAGIVQHSNPVKSLRLFPRNRRPLFTGSRSAKKLGRWGKRCRAVGRHVMQTRHAVSASPAGVNTLRINFADVPFSGGSRRRHLASAALPEVGQIALVRDRHWVVADVQRSTQVPDALAAATEAPQTLIELTSVEDDGFGDDLNVIWEVEPGARVLETATLPRPTPGRFDDPERLDAFLDAVLEDCLVAHGL